MPPTRTSAARGNGTRLKPSTPSFGSIPAKPLTIAVPSRNGIGGPRRPISPLLTYAGRYSGRAVRRGGGLSGSDILQPRPEPRDHALHSHIYRGRGEAVPDAAGGDPDAVAGGASAAEPTQLP